ncbi:hypothetical protein ACFE04_005506 [Oxalis oulophora]
MRPAPMKNDVKGGDNNNNNNRGLKGSGSSEEESRVDNVTIGGRIISKVPGGLPAANVYTGLQISQQQQPQQASVVQWDRFLPVRSLKVLLVENDDSTRQVVSALLRNCSYEVTAVANGFQAWKILEDLTNPVDLILTEVVMPVISGISLLYKIMDHKTLKNVPVIMMSSHDSMGIVFKCLSKGAVDFLVKPIRKNELKNLWQHVWRRCHSSSGSGSGSGSECGTQTKRTEKSKHNNDDSGENSGSSDEQRDNRSNGLSNRDGSDNGSGTQSSWTKKAAEHDSPQPLSPPLLLAYTSDSTCAQAIHTKPETCNNKKAYGTETKECQEQDEQQQVDTVVAKDMETDESRNPDLSFYLSGRKQSNLSDWETEPFERALPEQKIDNNRGKLDLAPSGNFVIANTSNPQPEIGEFDGTNGPSDDAQVKDKACHDNGEIPSLELTLKGPRGVANNRNGTSDDRNVLRHSDLSAFSKYNTASSAGQGNDNSVSASSFLSLLGPTGNVGSNSPHNNSSEALKTETMQNFPSPNGNPHNQQSNGSSDNNDMASSAKYANPKPETFNEKSENVSAFKPFHSTAFKSTQNGNSSVILPPNQILNEKSNEVDDNNDPQQNFQVVHHHHHHHHYHHHVHKRQQQQAEKKDLTMKDMATNSRPCGSSNALLGPTEGTEDNNGNYNVNGCGSGSNQGSNGKNGSSNGLNTGLTLTNVKTDTGEAGISGSGVGTNGRTSGSGVDEDRAAQREAALIKFRLKRKERCFDKKVRYQSRKTLAEQRPRVKGQFVRQKKSDSKAGNECPSSDIASDDNSCDESAR